MVLSAWTIPLLILLAEVCVVTLGTLRTIFISRGQRLLAPLLGFFEILIWLFAISQIMQKLDDWACFLAFAIGFTFGNLFGILIERRLAMGTTLVRIITHRDPCTLIEQLRSANFGVTRVEGEGAKGKVQVVLTVVKRKQLPDVVGLIKKHHPNAFYAVDEIQAACDGIFPKKRATALTPLPLSILVDRLRRPFGTEVAMETKGVG